jgi:fructose-specific phosphotransferase system IIA component
MRLTEILQPQCIQVPLDSDDKQAAIFELIELLGEHGLITEVDDIKQAVWHRETTRTTGIGHGLAIPHGKSNCCQHLTMAIGKPAKPIDFNSIDGKPVNLIILLISPADQTGPHIQALAQISRMMTDSQFRSSMMTAENAEQVYTLIAEHEKAMSSGS